jgi:hypothetical protein
MHSLFFLVHEQVCRNDVAKLERPLEAIATVASTLGYLSDPGDVSTMLLIPPGSSLTH